VNMSTPTTVSANAGVAGKGRLKRKADEVEEISPTPQLESQGHSYKETNAAKFKKIKLAAVSQKSYRSLYPYPYLTLTGRLF
ncbi:hypothetical protein FS837_008162, partial [Tulasnella sp. UAMH 9824]